MKQIKHIFGISMFLSAVLFTHSAIAASEITYKGLRLGSTLTEFKKKFPEFNCTSSSNNKLTECKAHNSTYAELPAELTIANFTSGNLFSIEVKFKQDTQFNSVFIDSILNANLTEKYGSPTFQQQLSPDGPGLPTITKSSVWGVAEESLSVRFVYDVVKNQGVVTVSLLKTDRRKNKAPDF